MMTQLEISTLAVVGVLVLVAIGRAIAGSRFERELRLVRFEDEERWRGIRPIALNASRARLSRPSDVAGL